MNIVSIKNRLLCYSPGNDTGVKESWEKVSLAGDRLLSLPPMHNLEFVIDNYFIPLDLISATIIA